jgi:Na+/pantothenate symporter
MVIWSAIAGMIVGSATPMLRELSRLSDKLIYEIVPAIIFGFTAVAIVSLVARRNHVSKG